ncbi:MAG: exopolysaccharide biosynthesis protein, partial [Pseudomonadota bacterium]
IPFGMVILFIGFRMLFGKSFWLPSFVANKTINSDLVLKIFTSIKPLMKRFSRWVKPRGRFFANHPGSKRVSFFLICCCGFLLLLPLPPGTNAPPAFTAAALSLGVLEEDGVYLLVGYFCFFLISILFLALAFWGYPQVIRWFGY